MLLSQVTYKRGTNTFVKEPTIVVVYNTRLIRQLDCIYLNCMCKCIGLRVVALSIMFLI